ncbi:MAG: hypothetical protein JWN52_6623 [Actinomycetia bacterium]|nr:hypothetical protein [Actinomycetes bacterium]
MADLPLSRQRCRDAFAATMTASACLANWHAKAPEPFNLHAHEAMASIDEAMRALLEARAALLTELRKDQDERAALDDERATRIEGLLAECRKGGA